MTQEDVILNQESSKASQIREEVKKSDLKSTYNERD